MCSEVREGFEDREASSTHCGKPSLRTLRDAFADLPDATYEDFVEIKALWRPRELE